MISLKRSKTNSRSSCDGSSRRLLLRAFFCLLGFPQVFFRNVKQSICKNSEIFFQHFFTRFPAVFHFFELVQNLPFRDTYVANVSLLMKRTANHIAWVDEPSNTLHIKVVGSSWPKLEKIIRSKFKNEISLEIIFENPYRWPYMVNDILVFFYFYLGQSSSKKS